MSKLVPLSAATCPHCRKKNTKRVGYDEERGGSLWQCGEEECKQRFIVPTLSLVKKPV